MAGNIDLQNSNDPPHEEDHYQSSSSEIPQFQSALSYTTVRDFAYPAFHPLHYGALQQDSEEDEDATYPDDGPPWQEDADLASPVIKSHDVGDRISREYEFSVASADEIHGRAVALFDFTPENENEAPLTEGQLIWVSYRHGQGWLVAEDPESGETGLVPEEYVELIPNHEARRIHEAQLQANKLNDKPPNDDNNDNGNDNDDSPDSFHSTQSPPPSTTDVHIEAEEAMSKLDLNKA